MNFNAAATWELSSLQRDMSICSDYTNYVMALLKPRIILLMSITFLVFLISQPISSILTIISNLIVRYPIISSLFGLIWFSLCPRSMTSETPYALFTAIAMFCLGFAETAKKGEELPFALAIPGLLLYPSLHNLAHGILFGLLSLFLFSPTDWKFVPSFKEGPHLLLDLLDVSRLPCSEWDGWDPPLPAFQIWATKLLFRESYGLIVSATTISWFTKVLSTNLENKEKLFLSSIIISAIGGIAECNFGLCAPRWMFRAIEYDASLTEKTMDFVGKLNWILTHTARNVLLTHFILNETFFGVRIHWIIGVLIIYTSWMIMSILGIFQLDAIEFGYKTRKQIFESLRIGFCLLMITVAARIVVPSMWRLFH